MSTPDSATPAPEPLPAAPKPVDDPTPAGTPAPAAEAASAVAAEPAAAPVVPAPPPLTVALIGKVSCAGIGVAQALLDAGLKVRVLCANAEDESLVRNLKVPVNAPERPLQAVLGSEADVATLANLFTGANAAAYLSPVGLNGREWRPDAHLKDLAGILEQCSASKVPKFVYLSAIGAMTDAPARCLREAFEAERRVTASHLTEFVLRAGPLMGPGDDLMSRVAQVTQSGSPCMGLWSYGDTQIQPLHAYDLGRCILRCISGQPEPLRSGTYTVAGGETLEYRELFDRALARKKRLKLKFHAPFFALKLAGMFAGPEFQERLELLTAPFCADHNDVAKLLGSVSSLRGLDQTLDECA